MAFQSTIASDQALGVIGEIVIAGPTRADPGILKGTAALIVVGRWFTFDTADSTYQPGAAVSSTVVPGGLLANPKGYASPGTVAGGPLAPTLTLLAGTVGEFLTMTSGVIVACANAAKVGDPLFYTNATGIISAGTASTGETQIKGAIVARTTNASAGLIIMSLTGPLP